MFSNSLGRTASLQNTRESQIYLPRVSLGFQKVEEPTPDKFKGHKVKIWFAENSFKLSWRNCANCTRFQWMPVLIKRTCFRLCSTKLPRLMSAFHFGIYDIDCGTECFWTKMGCFSNGYNVGETNVWDGQTAIHGIFLSAPSHSSSFTTVINFWHFENASHVVYRLHNNSVNQHLPCENLRFTKFIKTSL